SGPTTDCSPSARTCGTRSRPPSRSRARRRCCCTREPSPTRSTCSTTRASGSGPGCDGTGGMPLITLRRALDAARAGGYAVGAFNVSDLVQAEAVLDAAEATGSPVILASLAGITSHGSDERFWAGLHDLIGHYPTVPVVLHLDHGPDPSTCYRAMDAGFTSVMIDGSLRDGRPATFDENVAVTVEVAEVAHERGISVEGELGTIGGAEGDGTRAEIQLADPEEGRRFVDRTRVDALAIAIGTSHGAYKFATPPRGDVLRLDLVAEFARIVPD